MRCRGRSTCRSSSIAGRPTPSSGTHSATPRSSWAESCWARSAWTRRPASRSSGSPQSLEAKHYANTQASFTYTHDSWEEITRERDRLFPDYDIVGWYHTHPSFGIFLSHHDLFIHQNFFAQPLQVAYVVDPIKQTRGFFQWRDRRAGPGRRVLSDRRSRRPDGPGAAGQRPGKLPQPRGRGGGLLSPRLEAELIKMLNRPPPRSMSIPPLTGFRRPWSSACSGRSWACWAWPPPCGSTSSTAGSRNRASRFRPWPARSIRSGVSGLTVDTLLEKAGTDNPTQFAERYERAAKARDEARRQLGAQQSINETLGIRTRELESVAAKLATDLESTSKTLVQYEVDAKQAPELRERIADLEKNAGEAPARAGREDRERRGRRRPEGGRGSPPAQPVPLRHVHPWSLERGVGGGGRLFHAATSSARRSEPRDSSSQRRTRSPNDRAARDVPARFTGTAGWKGSRFDGSKMYLVISPHTAGYGDRAGRRPVCPGTDVRMTLDRKNKTRRARCRSAVTKPQPTNCVRSRCQSPARRRCAFIVAVCGSGPSACAGD